MQLAGADREARKAPEHTRRLFRRPDGLGLPHPHHHGPPPRQRFGCPDGDRERSSTCSTAKRVQLESPLGPQAIAWTGTQPSFGTIRRFLMDEDIAADTEAFLVIHDDGTLQLRACP